MDARRRRCATRTSTSRAALAAWEPGQLALGRGALERTRRAGERAQHTDEWRVGEPLPWGLYATGDSALD